MINDTTRNKIQSKHHGGSLLLFHIGAIFTVSVWGTSFISTEILLHHGIGPVVIYIIRFAIAYLVLLLIDHQRIMAQTWTDELLLLLCGITSGSIYFLAENTALLYTQAANVSLITSMAPLLTALLIGLLYKSERPSSGTWIGSAIAFIGVGCVIFNSGVSEGHDRSSGMIGDFLSLSAAISWAVYSIILRRVSANYSTTFITRKTLFYGVITALPFLSIESRIPDCSVFMETEVIFNILFLGLVASLICFFLWSVSVKRLGAIQTSNYLYFSPVVTMIVAWIVLGETVNLMGYIGCALVISGLILGDYLSKYMRRTPARK